MEFKKIIELFQELKEARESHELEWTSTGKTRYETNWNGQEIIIDRRNNINKSSSEICLKIGDFEKEFLPKSEEFDSLAKILDAI